MKKNTFVDFGLQAEILKSIALLNFKYPTNVQTMLIETMLNFQDAVVQSQTGSGKTAAYAIPICQMLDWNENKPQALILAPTRELAMQIREDVFNIGRFKRIKVVVLIGQTPFSYQKKQLTQKMHVVVGTPGRVMDHIQRGTLDLSQLQFLIIDEADEMLNLGFMPQLDEIVKTLKKDRQTVLLSATMPERLEVLIGDYCHQAHIITIEEEDKVSNRIEQYVYEVTSHTKFQALKDVLTLENPDSCIIFANQKITVDDIVSELTKLHYPVFKLHGGLEQDERTEIINDFKSGAFRYLVATDVAARGLDIESVSLIINFDTPLEGEAYTHRIGRTGRFDQSGKAITLLTSNQGKYLKNIEAYIGLKLLPYAKPTVDQLLAAKPEFTSKKSTLPKSKGHKTAALNQGISSIQIKAGKQDKLRTVDIVGALCGLNQIESDDIGVIHIGDFLTDVEILNNKGKTVVDQLQTVSIKGKIRKVFIKPVK